MNWDFILESVLTFFLMWYYILEGVIKTILPSKFFYRRKLFHHHDNHDSDLQNNSDIALITGAGSGIGRQLAVKFHKLNAIVVLWDIDKEGNKETARILNDNEGEGRVFTYTVDVSNREQVYATAEKVKEEVGHVSILVNNAGVMFGKRLLDCPDEMIQRTISVNTMSHFWAVKAFLPKMLEKNRGHIVGMASIASFAGSTHLVDYCTSKFALIGFYESLDLELKSMHKKIATTVVCPYLVRTPLTSGVPENRVKSIVRECALEAEYVADQVVEAILKNQALKLIPSWIHIVYALKGIAPVKIWFAIEKFAGTADAMEHFQARDVKMHSGH